MNGRTLKTTSTVSAAIASAGRLFIGEKRKLHSRGLTRNRQAENSAWSRLHLRQSAFVRLL
jgi:hypothetical protein